VIARLKATTEARFWLSLMASVLERRGMLWNASIRVRLWQFCAGRNPTRQ
jgi:hypothetical protein